MDFVEVEEVEGRLLLLTWSLAFGERGGLPSPRLTLPLRQLFVSLRSE